MSRYHGSWRCRTTAWERRFEAVQKREPKPRVFNIIFQDREDGAGKQAMTVYRSLHRGAGGRFIRLTARLRIGLDSYFND